MKFILSFVVSLSICVTFASDIPLRGKSTTDYHETDFTFSQNNIAYHMARFSDLAYKSKEDLAKESADLSVEFQDWEIEKVNKKLLHGKQKKNGKTLHVYAFEGTRDGIDAVADVLLRFKPLSENSRLKAHTGIVEHTSTVLPNANLPITWNDYIIFTGHSLGGAMANIAAAQVAEASPDTSILERTALITFAAPPVFEDESAILMDSWYPNMSHLRVTNLEDIIPRYREIFVQTVEATQNFELISQVLQGIEIFLGINSNASTHAGSRFSLPSTPKEFQLFQYMEIVRAQVLPNLNGKIFEGSVINHPVSTGSQLVGHSMDTCYISHLKVYNLVLAAKAAQNALFVITLIGLLSIKQLVENSQTDV